MKSTFTILFLALCQLSLWAQSPESISYQAVVRSSDGELVAEQSVGVQISILQGSASGDASYAETHTVTTNANGLFSLQIGAGSSVSGTFSSIDWSAGSYFVQTDIDPEGGTDYSITATSQLLSVPYALYAKTAGSYSETDPVFSSSVAAAITSADTTKWASGTQLTEEEIIAYVSDNGYLSEEVDGDTTNEIQDLSLSDNSLTITNNASATTIDLSPYLDNTDTQLTEEEVDAYVSDNGYLTAEVDADTTNEIQDLSLTNNSLSVTNNASATAIDLSSYLDNTDDQTLSLDTTALSIEGGNYVDLSSIIPDDQTLSLDGTTLSISDGNSVDLSSVVSSGYSIGDQLDGGIVFYVDETGQHGLICAITDQASSIAWSLTSGITGGQFFGVGGGYMNTMLIVASQLGDYLYSNATSSYAAYFCAYYYTTVDGTQIGGWYLPNLQELRLMADAKDEIDAAVTLIGGTALSTDPYWTSQEGGIDTNTYAQAFDMSYTQYGKAKTETLAVRAIKRF